MDDLELQVGLIDLNVGELTSLAHGMNTNITNMCQDINMINHNLMAYLNSQNFCPPPYAP